MKILLSAYACEPNRGSEPGVGWHWALEIEKLGHEVWILTRSNNKPVIDEYYSQNKQPSNLHFAYFDLPDEIKKWKKGGRLVRTYYFLWQWGASSFAKQLHKQIDFDSVQHITFVSVRQPSFMWRLNIPFIFGPVAGGERAPLNLRWNFGLKGFVVDLLRDVANALVRLDPFMWMTFKKASKIIVTSEQTQQLIPNRFRDKSVVQLAIGIDEALIKKSTLKNKLLNYKILFIGRFIYWKGMNLGLVAFSQVLKKHPEMQLTLVGEGADKQRWMKQAMQLGISDSLNWVDWVNQDELTDIYQAHDLLLFPSLHDSGGMVVLEAMAQGIPVACLNLGGPGVIVDNDCGINIKVKARSKEEIIDALAEKMTVYFNDTTYRMSLRKQSLEKCKSYQWKNVVANVYERECYL